MTEKNITTILNHARVIAMVGLSPTPGRASRDVADYLIEKGYRIIPINPNYDKVLNLTCYGSLSDIPSNIKVDIVDVFRKAEDTPPIAEQAVEIEAQCLWLQLGIKNETTREIAEKSNLFYVENRCIKIEHMHRFGQAAPHGDSE